VSTRQSSPDRSRKPVIDRHFRGRIQRPLLAWFDQERRDLPWRRNRDPYRIWVSEVMLQQTQVATVVRYYEPFLKAFPTIAALAAASEQQVLRRWEGLGYYRRARHLHQAARQLVLEHQGNIADDPEIFGRLPGVGRYILGAVLSQAFDRRLPILEANSQRVLCRLFCRKGDRGLLKRWLWQAAEGLLPARRVGDFNQALMELGALVCTPRAPRCSICPLRLDCLARRRGWQEAIPSPAPDKKSQLVNEAGLVVRRGQKVLLVQRPENGRWAGMWEFPHDSLQGKETHEAAAWRCLSELTGLSAALGPELMTLRHAVMHYRITLVCFEASYRGGRFSSAFYQQGRWLPPHQLWDYPISAPQRRLAQALVRPGQKSLF
jgi:A/G-specific adenine glycosylase